MAVWVLYGVRMWLEFQPEDISDQLGIPFALVVIFLAYANKYLKHLAVINIAFEEPSQTVCIGLYRLLKALIFSTNCLFMNNTFFPLNIVFLVF